MKLSLWPFHFACFRFHVSEKKYLKQVYEKISIGCKGESFHTKIGKE